ncbi:MAG: indolepyruvate oxidoreductase subunit beta [Deltaproteobacteria bacterium]|nr:indolepyruvate oxidoreductase subunit beta [Deltaproteobacteria bacterium]
MGVKNLFFAGVGGQGLVLSNQLQARAALRAGFDVKTSDVYGLAMRGGSVFGYNRFGDRVLTSTFAEGTGDVLVGLEPLEALRYARLLRPGGLAVVSTGRIFPACVLLGKALYPDDSVATLRGAGFEVVAIEGLRISREAGNPKMTNLAVLGALSLHLPEIPEEAYLEALRELVPEALFEPNRRAFELGRAAGRNEEGPGRGP